VNKLSWSRILSAAFVCAVAAPALAGQSVLLDQSELRFVAKQMNVPMQGKFRKFAAEVSLDPNRPAAAKAIITVDLNSVDFDSTEADTEVKRKQWLNTAAFPQAKFTLASLRALGGGRYEARGKLALKGITRDVSAPVTLKQQGGQSTAEGSFALRRLDFEIGEGEWSATDTVANDVQVQFRLVMTGVPAAK
jgi:polyisoprenoid-binding protein YceI